jgi:hypothetical protein
MAEKVRIYQLARDLEIDTKDLLAMLDDMGVAYKSHASTLEGDVAETVRQLVSEAAARRPPRPPGPRAAASAAAAAGARGPPRPAPPPAPRRPAATCRCARRS